MWVYIILKDILLVKGRCVLNKRPPLWNFSRVQERATANTLWAVTATHLIRICFSQDPHGVSRHHSEARLWKHAAPIFCVRLRPRGQNKYSGVLVVKILKHTWVGGRLASPRALSLDFQLSLTAVGWISQSFPQGWTVCSVIKRTNQVPKSGSPEMAKILGKVHKHSKQGEKKCRVENLLRLRKLRTWTG